MILYLWFHENHMTLNPGKRHYMVIGGRDLSHEIMLSNSKIISSNEEKLLGIFLDIKLIFQSHIGSLCRKASQEINALARLKNFLTSDQRNLLLLDTVIKSQFTYCPLIRMFTSRCLNNTLNNIHERALRLIFKDHEKSFDRILTENNLKTIHQKTLNFLPLKYTVFKMACLRQSWMMFSCQDKNIYNLHMFQEPQLKSRWISVWKLFLIDVHNYGS